MSKLLQERNALIPFLSTDSPIFSSFATFTPSIPFPSFASTFLSTSIGFASFVFNFGGGGGGLTSSVTPGTEYTYHQRKMVKEITRKTSLLAQGEPDMTTMITIWTKQSADRRGPWGPIRLLVPYAREL